MSIEVKVNRIHRMEAPRKSLRAFADVEINGSLLVKGLQVLEGKKGLFVSMPRQKGKDNNWYEIVRTLTPETKQLIVSTVLSAYEKKEFV